MSDVFCAYNTFKLKNDVGELCPTIVGPGGGAVVSHLSRAKINGLLNNDSRKKNVIRVHP